MNISTKLKDFVNKTRWPGWYVDVRGCYWCMLTKHLISVFEGDAGELEITVDTIGPNGFFDKTLEWETLVDEQTLVIAACRFVRKYAGQIY